MIKYTISHLLTLVIVLLGLSSFKCSKDEKFPYDGTWRAYTKHNLTYNIGFYFKVDENSIKEIIISLKSLTFFCPLAPNEVVINGNFPIQGDSFTIPGSYNISGTFNSSNNASGSFNFDLSNIPNCNFNDAYGTWDADK